MNTKNIILKNLHKLSELEQRTKDTETILQTEPTNEGFIKAFVMAKEEERAMSFMLTKQISRQLGIKEKDVRDMLLSNKSRIISMLQLIPKR